MSATAFSHQGCDGIGEEGCSQAHQWPCGPSGQPDSHQRQSCSQPECHILTAHPANRHSFGHAFEELAEIRTTSPPSDAKDLCSFSNPDQSWGPFHTQPPDRLQFFRSADRRQVDPGRELLSHLIEIRLHCPALEAGRFPDLQDRRPINSSQIETLVHEITSRRPGARANRATLPNGGKDG